MRRLRFTPQIGFLLLVFVEGCYPQGHSAAGRMKLILENPVT
jgi:hypothetical protein